MGDPPFGPKLRPSLWTICPWERISFNDTTFCIHYECTGTATVAVNSTESLRRTIEQQVIQGIGVDGAATFVDLVGCILEHYIMPRLVQPIVIS